MADADVHVRWVPTGWEVRREGERYPTSRHRTRFTALKNAREIAAESRSLLIVHELDGRVVADSGRRSSTRRRSARVRAVP